MAAFMCAAMVLGCMETNAPTSSKNANPAPALGASILLPTFADVLVASGFTNPTQMAFSPDGRLFVLEAAGNVRVIKNGTLLPTPFLTLNVSTAGERGVLGIAFDPDFDDNQYVYIYYTSPQGPHNRVSRFRASGDVAESGETILVDLPNMISFNNHNGGCLQFGPDGKLYIAVGDFGSGLYSQSMDYPMGKMLRINTDGSIPTDNPFYGSATGINQAIWMLGLRNPYTFAIQPGTGRMFVDDVGLSSWEEIDEGIRGGNFGWPETEGPHNDPRFEKPFYTYTHYVGCAVTGGVFYNPSTPAYPSDFVGDYFFTDYCGGWIKTIDPGTKIVTDFATGIVNPTDLDVGPDGALYYVLHTVGEIHKIIYAATQGPVFSQQPASQIVASGESVTFAVAASGTPPLTYQWQRNATDIPGATAPTYTLDTARITDNAAKFRCRVSDVNGPSLSNEAVLTVVAGSHPTAHITSPGPGNYSAGKTYNFSGTGVDPDDGPLPGSAFTWEIKFWHDDGNLHSHPAYGPVTGAVSFTASVPDRGEISPNVWYRVYLTVKDAQGLTGKDSMDYHPYTSTITLVTNPPGLQLKVDGVPVTSPYSFKGVVGMKRDIEAVSPQTVNGRTWTFFSWCDGGAALHAATMPESNLTCSAEFR